MIAKLLAKLGIGEKERKLIVRVFKLSLTGAILVALAAWGIQYAIIQKKTQKRVQEASDPTVYYEKKSKDLLGIDIEAHEFTAQYYLKNDQPQLAIEHILRIIPVQRANRGLKLDLATAYLTSGQYDKAYACFSTLTESEPDSIDRMTDLIRARMGLTLFYLAKIRESIEMLDKCISSGRQCPEALCYRGEVEAAVSSSPSAARAEEFFRRSLQADSSYVEAWYQLARYYMNQGDYSRARICLLRVLDIEPLHVKTHSRLGMIYYYLDQPELAKKSYLTALALNPQDYNTHYNLGELYYSKLNDEKHALDEFKKAIEGNPQHAEANFKIGLICLSNNMAKEAVSFFEKSRACDPKNIRVLLQLGVAYEKLSMKDDARQAYGAILEIDPLNRIAQQKTKLLASGQ
jgi:tetratricopeptide (TPR) repeat protein